MDAKRRPTITSQLEPVVDRPAAPADAFDAIYAEESLQLLRRLAQNLSAFRSQINRGAEAPTPTPADQTPPEPLAEAGDGELSPRDAARVTILSEQLIATGRRESASKLRLT